MEYEKWMRSVSLVILKITLMTVLCLIERAQLMSTKGNESGDETIAISLSDKVTHNGALFIVAVVFASGIYLTSASLAWCVIQRSFQTMIWLMVGVT